MGECSWSKPVKTEIVENGDQTIIVNATIRGGWSSMDDENDHVQWNTSTHTVRITCSKTKPSITFQGDTVDLPLNPEYGLPAVMESDAALYFKYCHSADYYNDDPINKFDYNITE